MGVIHGGYVIAQAAERIRFARVALAAADTAGGVLAWQNPEDQAIVVLRLVLNVTTKTSGACTLDFGPAANGTTSNALLIDGLDGNAATGVFDNIENGGSTGISTAKLAENGGATDYITGSKATGNAAGLVGYAYIYYLVV
jgi:hypothetical protein